MLARLTALLFPDPRRRLPHSRWWNIGARTVHLAATGILLGGHVFGADAGTLMPLLWVAIATGAVMIPMATRGMFGLWPRGFACRWRQLRPWRPQRFHRYPWSSGSRWRRRHRQWRRKRAGGGGSLFPHNQFALKCEL